MARMKGRREMGREMKVREMTRKGRWESI